MKQLLQSARTGELRVAEVPAPQPQAGQVLIRTGASLVSAGTERMAREFAEKNLLQKAQSRPDLVRKVLDKARTEGVLTAVQAAFHRLDVPQSLGYSSAGTVVSLGERVVDLQVGDRVACAGAGYAVHAEFASVPRNLVAKIPSADVSLEEAAFTTVGCIALHGFRLAEVALGETVAVIGLGLIGLIAVQLARAAGCRVIGMDPDAARCRLAQELGCEGAMTDAAALRQMAAEFPLGGVDAVLIAAATVSNAPVELAAEVARERGRVVAIGAVGTELPRRAYYDKELGFRVSRSYGPGRYDVSYEEQGQDYPPAYVRWTENRNMEAFLQLLAERKVDVRPLISHRFPIAEAAAAYDLLSGRESLLGIVLTFQATAERPTFAVSTAATPLAPGKAKIGVLGAGSFATGTLLPLLQAAQDVELVGVCAARGSSAQHASSKFGFRVATTDENEVLHSEADAIVIATRHHLHARQVIAALESGKHVFVEKPLALTEEELQAVAAACERAPGRILMVGFNRRFAPMAHAVKEFFAGVSAPLMIHYRVNAGRIPRDHWTQGAEGGGRVIGEVCHFVDFAGWLIGESPSSVSAEALPDAGIHSQDNVVLTLRYPGGSVALITYLACGDRLAGKERVEVHGGGRSAVLEDFRRLECVASGRRTVRRSWFRADKGHGAEIAAFIHALRTGGPSPIAFADLAATTRATFLALESLRTGEPRSIPAG